MVGDVEIYDISTGKIDLAASMPTPRFVFSTARVGDVIHTIGGGLPDEARTNIVESFDTSTNTWSSDLIPPLNVARGEHTSAVIDDRIYVLGGFDGTTSVESIEVYTPGDDSWDTIPIPSGFATSTHSSVYRNGYIVSFGNYKPANIVTAYHVPTNTWSKLSIPFIPSRQTGAEIFDDKVYISGGSDEYYVWRYFTQVIDWRTIEEALAKAGSK